MTFNYSSKVNLFEILYLFYLSVGDFTLNKNVGVDQNEFESLYVKIGFTR